MYIKEIKTRNKKTGREYIKHTLVESIRTDKGPSQRMVMQHGQLKLPKESWSVLIAELESRISGQDSLNIAKTKVPLKIRRAADSAMEKFTIYNARRVENRKNSSSEVVTLNLNNVSSFKHRSFGSEFIVHNTWNELQMSQTLKSLDFSAKERSFAEDIVAGRLIEPACELATWDWLKIIHQ